VVITFFPYPHPPVKSLSVLTSLALSSIDSAVRLGYSRNWGKAYPVTLKRQSCLVLNAFCWNFSFELNSEPCGPIKTQLDPGSLNLEKYYLEFNNQAMKLLLFIVLISWSEHSKRSIVFLSISITDYFLILIKNIFWKCTVESINPCQTLLLVRGWGQNKQLDKPFKNLS